VESDEGGERGAMGVRLCDMACIQHEKLTYNSFFVTLWESGVEDGTDGIVFQFLLA
jgi:hypothetical protein